MPIDQKYTVRFSTPKHFDAIRDFYSSDLRRTENVFLRQDELLKKQADLGRFITVWNQDERLVAASSLYILAEGKEIECEIHDGGEVERGRVVELGSVLRVGKDPNDPPIDKGFWRLILFGVPMIAALKFDLPMDILMSGIQNSDCGDRTKRYIRGEYPGSPLKYKRITPASETLDAFGVVTNGQFLGDSEFFRIYAPDVIPVAEALLKISEEGCIKDLRAANEIGYDPYLNVPMDLSELKIVPLLKCIVKNSAYFNSSPKTLSWHEAGRQLRSRLPSNNIFANGVLPSRKSGNGAGGLLNHNGHLAVCSKQ